MTKAAFQLDPMQKLDAKDLLAQALQRSTWEALEPPPFQDVTPAPSPDAGALHAALMEEGYFQAPEVVSPAAAAALLACVDRVKKAGWPASFAFATEGMWRLLAQPSLLATIRGVMGQGALQLPRVWVHQVSTLAGAQGYEPHGDYPGPLETVQDGTPSRLSAWLALSDATVDNGCMHLIPKNVLPHITNNLHTLKSMSADEAIALLHNSRALPIPAGGLLGWDMSVIHWGGTSTGRAMAPRLAVSLEIMHAQAVPEREDMPVMTLGTIPTHEQRIHMVGMSLALFGGRMKREPTASKFHSLASGLLAAW